MRNPVKEKLARGELVASMIVRLVAGVEIVRIAKSAGFDSLAGDPLGGFTLEPEHIVTLTRELVNRAASWCKGRVVSALEGGYAPERVGAACVAHMRALSQAATFGS